MEGVYCVVLFVDINQAFYSAIIEFALGPLTLQAVRLVVLQALRFTPAQLDEIEKTGSALSLAESISYGRRHARSCCWLAN